MDSNEVVLSAQKKERLAHIEFIAYFLGKVGRKDLVERFGISEPAATRDFREYNKLAPNNLIYDLAQRVYLANNNFSPAFKLSPEKCLSTLTAGYGDCLYSNDSELCFSAKIGVPDLNKLSIVTRAISLNRPIKIHYASTTSGVSEKEIIPFAIIDNGIRWHVRAYDREKTRFADFVVNRIIDVDFANNQIVLEHERINKDSSWNDFVELRIQPHPSLRYKEAIEIEYNMKDGFFSKKIRLALVGYILRSWNVDSTSDASLVGGHYQLHLANAEEVFSKYPELNFLAPR